GSSPESFRDCRAVVRQLQAGENELISVAESRKAKTAVLSKAMERFRETLRIAGAVCLPSTSVSLFFSCLLFSSCAQMGDASRRKKALKHGGVAQLSSRSCLERFAPVVVCLVLAAIVLIVFGQTLQHEFVN